METNFMCFAVRVRKDELMWWANVNEMMQRYRRECAKVYIVCSQKCIDKAWFCHWHDKQSFSISVLINLVREKWFEKWVFAQ